MCDLGPAGLQTLLKSVKKDPGAIPPIKMQTFPPDENPTTPEFLSPSLVSGRLPKGPVISKRYRRRLRSSKIPSSLAKLWSRYPRLLWRRRSDRPSHHNKFVLWLYTRLYHQKGCRPSHRTKTRRLLSFCRLRWFPGVCQKFLSSPKRYRRRLRSSKIPCSLAEV